MNGLEQVEAENQKIASDMIQLAGTEDSRISVITAIFVRLNNEMRLENVQEIRRDISYGAKDYGLLPEKYVNSMDSIVRSYVQEINKFMKAYNDEFMNIQNVLKSAEERQKYYFYKIRETIVMRDICELAGKNPEDYKELDAQIKSYRKKLATYEKIIVRCDKEFEDCKIRRDQDFKDLFELKQENALAVIQKRNVITMLINKIKNRLNGYERFSKYVLQKHAGKLNRMRTETTGEYVTKIKKNILSFDSEIEGMLNA
ncbi:MAG: hypothetical protein IJ629_01135 [Clostridia bacterium]|nr:hypothetical protein [Clostridia bacterium]